MIKQPVPARALKEIIGELTPGEFYSIPTSTLEQPVEGKAISGCLISYNFSHDSLEGEVALMTYGGLVKLLVGPDTFFKPLDKHPKLEFSHAPRYGENMHGLRIVGYDGQRNRARSKECWINLRS